MSGLEKGIIAAMVLAACLWFASTWFFISKVNDAGGARQVIVEIGKEIKSISDEIKE